MDNYIGDGDGLDINVSTRKEITELYTITDGRIVNKGIFENAPIYTPFYYSLLIDSSAWEHEYIWEDQYQPVIGFVIENSHVGQFPELAKRLGDWCVLWMGLRGVYCSIMQPADFANLLEAYHICTINRSKKKGKKDKKKRRKCDKSTTS